MITPDEIREKAVRLYPKFVKAWLAGEEFFPRRIPANLRLPNDLAAAKFSVDRLRDHSKQSKGYGYSIAWRSRRSKSHGLNEFPHAIAFECAADLLAFINHTERLCRKLR